MPIKQLAPAHDERRQLDPARPVCAVQRGDLLGPRDGRR